MKRFFLSLCFVAFLGGGLVSCSDDAAEVAPKNPNFSEYATENTDGPGEKGGATRPGGN